MSDSTSPAAELKRMRTTWDQTWLGVARCMTHRSRCVRDQVGCVIVDPDNRVVATSYNGPAAGYPLDGWCSNFCERAECGPTEKTLVSYEDCPSLHAEANSLLVCDRSQRVGGTIYVTSDVCWSCAKLIANSGLLRVVVPRDEFHSYRDPIHSYDLLRDCGLTVDVI